MTACVKGIIEKYETLFITLMRLIKSLELQAATDASAIKHIVDQQYVKIDNLRSNITREVRLHGF